MKIRQLLVHRIRIRPSATSESACTNTGRPGLIVIELSLIRHPTALFTVFKHIGHESVFANQSFLIFEFFKSENNANQSENV